MEFFTTIDCGFNFTDATSTLEGEELTCVDKDGSLCTTLCQAQRYTLLKHGNDTMVTCRLSSKVDYAGGMVEGRSFNPSNILVACSLNCVAKRQK